MLRLFIDSVLSYFWEFYSRNLLFVTFLAFSLGIYSSWRFNSTGQRPLCNSAESADCSRRKFIFIRKRYCKREYYISTQFSLQITFRISELTIGERLSQRYQISHFPRITINIGFFSDIQAIKHRSHLGTFLIYQNSADAS